MGDKPTLLQRIDLGLTRVEENFLVLGIFSMGAVMTCQVFSRALFGRSIVWSEELVRHIFIWTIFIGMSYGVAKRYHVSLEYFIDRFSPPARRAILIAVDAAILVLLAYLFKPAILYAADQMRLRAPTMGYPMGYVMLAMPVSIVLTAFRLSRDIARLWKTGGAS